MSGAGWHFIDEEEERLVLEVLRSRKISRYRGPDDVEPSKTALFETEFALSVQVDYCLGMNSCTSALLAGLLALDIGPGDEVIVPGYTFVATIASVVYTGAVPILAEIDESLTLDPEDVEKRITNRTKAIIAVHMLGAPCDMAALSSIAKDYGLALVEDVAQAGGGRFRAKPLGSWGRFGAFSLNVFKVLTAGDGGVMSTNDRELYERAFAIHDHGFKRYAGGTIDGDTLFGLNLRMHELTGAMALAQVRKLDRILAHLRAQKARLLQALDVPRGLRKRRLNDPEGECATTLVYFAKSEDQANALAARIGSRTLARTVKHYYGAMGQLRNKRLPNCRWAPFHSPAYPFEGDYRSGMLPRTDDLLGRAVGIGVGVRDDFLGFGFGVDVHADAESILAVARQFVASAESVIGGVG